MGKGYWRKGILIVLILGTSVFISVAFQNCSDINLLTMKPQPAPEVIPPPASIPKSAELLCGMADPTQDTVAYNATGARWDTNGQLYYTGNMWHWSPTTAVHASYQGVNMLVDVIAAGNIVEGTSTTYFYLDNLATTAADLRHIKYQGAKSYRLKTTGEGTSITFSYGYQNLDTPVSDYVVSVSKVAGQFIPGAGNSPCYCNLTPRGGFNNSNTPSSTVCTLLPNSIYYLNIIGLDPVDTSIIDSGNRMELMVQTHPGLLVQ